MLIIEIRNHLQEYFNFEDIFNHNVGHTSCIPWAEPGSQGTCQHFLLPGKFCHVGAAGYSEVDPLCLPFFPQLILKGFFLNGKPFFPEARKSWFISFLKG